jgi:hypothetical protein
MNNSTETSPTGAAVTASPMAPTNNRYHTVVDWPKHHPWPSVSGLRHLIFHAQKFGFEKCIRRVGRRILISENDFFGWLASNGGDTSGRF